MFNNIATNNINCYSKFRSNIYQNNNFSICRGDVVSLSSCPKKSYMGVLKFEHSSYINFEIYQTNDGIYKQLTPLVKKLDTNTWSDDDVNEAYGIIRAFVFTNIDYIWLVASIKGFQNASYNKGKQDKQKEILATLGIKDNF